MTDVAANGRNPELDRCVKALRPSLWVIAAISGISNILALTSSIFMLTVYDRVIPSGSVPTLLVLGGLAFFFYAVQSGFDMLRSRMLTRVGLSVKDALTPRIYDIAIRRSATRDGSSANVARDLDQVQSYLSSMGPVALFDLPWLPIFLGICFAFHFWIGMSVVVGALLLIGLTFLSNRLSKEPTRAINEALTERETYLGRSQMHAETIRAMGMTHAMSARWNSISARLTDLRRQVTDVTSTLGTLSRTTRMMLQSFVLAVGALLVIRQEATGGIIIASSILSARTLAPIELAIANWRNLVTTRQAWARLGETLRKYGDEAERFVLPTPAQSMAAEGVSIMLAGTSRILVRNVSFRLRSGQGLGVIGPTGSGKSTLAKAMVGLNEPSLGSIKLDGQDIKGWSAAERGRFIGYLPQTVPLFEGTIAENIARFQPDADPANVIAAARRADIHDLISKLPNGYETQIDASGEGLSGGQIQRVGLARAMFGDPFVLVLDEPNSNLDDDGERALQRAMNGFRERGGIVVIITHRPQALAGVDQVLVLQNGRVTDYGTRDDVLARLSGKGAKAKPTGQQVIPPGSVKVEKKGDARLTGPAKKGTVDA